MRHTSAFVSDCIKMLAFPVIFAGSGLALYGFSFHPIAVYTILFISIVVAVCLEYLIPFDRSWNKSQNDVPTDTAHFIVAILTSSFTKTFAILLHAWLARLFPISMVNLFGAQQFVVKVLFAMIISGFMPYWLHRASHLTSGFLWRIHSVHHVPERLYWFNSTHMHPINVMWNTFLSLFPLYVLGFDNEVIMMTGVLNNIVSIYNHANIDLKLGWLNWIFNMNELHRWHHSKRIEEANHNFSAGSLIFWDIVFGKRYLPKKNIPTNGVGVQNPGIYPQRYLTQLCYPFCSCKNE